MKYVVIIGDGMADRPIKELDGKTPLQKAFTPHMDKLACEGIIGKVRTIPRGFYPGSDVANMSVLGYNPVKFYSGRAPLEAASIGVNLKDDDVAYRCNLVTLRYSNGKTFMEDYSGGHITTEEARQLLSEINTKLGTEEISFYAGVGYRHLMVWSGGPVDIECTPPHDITGKDIADYLPTGNGENVLRSLMLRSTHILEKHSVNKERLRKGKNPANSIWLWGHGKRPRIPLFREKYPVSGALVSAVDLIKGLGIYAGFEILDVPGITGYLEDNYIGMVEASLSALEKVDLVYIHVEAPDEAGHSGNYKDKIKAIEDLDSLVLGAVIKGLKEFKEYRILLMPDHATPTEIRTHTAEPVPFVIFDSRLKIKNKATFDETLLKKEGIINLEKGHKLMDYFILKG